MAIKEKADIHRIRQDFAKRLNTALDRIGVPGKHYGRQMAVAEMFEVTQKGAARWLEGRGLPDVTLWQDIAKKMNVRIEWLFFNLGPMESELPAQPLVSIQSILKIVDEAAKETGLIMTEQQKSRFVIGLYFGLTSQPS